MYSIFVSVSAVSIPNPSGERIPETFYRVRQTVHSWCGQRQTFSRMVQTQCTVTLSISCEFWLWGDSFTSLCSLYDGCHIFLQVCFDVKRLANVNLSFGILQDFHTGILLLLLLYIHCYMCLLICILFKVTIAHTYRWTHLSGLHLEMLSRGGGNNKVKTFWGERIAV